MLIRNFTLLLFVAACGGKTIDPLEDGGAEDSGPKKDVLLIDAVPPTDAFPLPDATPPDQCNDIDPGTKTVAVMQIAQNAPPFGGTSSSLQPGLYELVSLTIYTGPNGPSGPASNIAGQVHVSVANSADYIFQAATVQDNQSPTRSSSDGNISGPGVLAIAQTCPQAEAPTNAFYVADSSSWTIRVGSGNQTADEKFVLVGN